MADSTLITLLNSDVSDAVIMGIDRALTERSYAVIDNIIPHIDSPNKEINRRARLAAGELLQSLLLAAGHKVPWEAFCQKARVLKKIRPDIVEKLIKDIAAPAMQGRGLRLKMLTAIDKEAAEKVLNGSHFDTDPQFRATAVRLFLEVNSPDVQTRIMKFLTDKDPRVISNTLETLEQLRSQNLTGTFTRFRNNNDPRIKSVVLRALCHAGEHALHDDIKSFIENGTERHHAALAWLLPEVQSVIQDPLPILEKLTRSSFSVVKSSAVKALKRINSSAALKLLSSVNGLEQLFKEDEAREKLHLAQMEKDGRKKYSVVRNVSHHISAGAVSSLLPFVADTDPKVIVAALDAISIAPGKSVTEVASNQYTLSADPRIREAAVKIMYSAGKGKIYSDLTKMLADKNERMRAAAVHLIGEIGSNELYLCELLLKVAEDKSKLVNRFEKQAVRRIISRFKEGFITVPESVIIQAIKIGGSAAVISMPREKLHQAVSENLKIKTSAIERYTSIMADAALCEIKKDTFGMEIISFSERDGMELFLYYCENVRYGKTATWSTFSAGSQTVLQNISYLSQKHGRVMGNRTAFPLKELENSGLPKELDVAVCIAEIIKNGLCEPLTEGDEKFLLFNRTRIQKFINTLKWLPVFHKIITPTECL
ncbi:MAG: HEAT repeat domain-containing protein [Fibrobacteres bacterium]|nr:HEAT repeat domain-containing protein [Fibrobacterota bacterium]